MRILILLMSCLILASCATTRDKLTQEDIEMFEKTFEGNVTSKKIEEFDVEKEKSLLSFSSKTDLGMAFQIDVEQADGTIRKFYDYSTDPARIKKLRQYNRDIQNGDNVIINLGIYDASNEEEQFESITKVI